MLYAKVSVDLPEDPKVIEAGDLAELAYLRCVLNGRRTLCDGVIHRAVVPRWLAGIRGKPQSHMQKLVAVGLLVENPNGWAFPEDVWREWNPSRSDIEDARVAKQNAAAHGNHQRWHSEQKPNLTCGLCADQGWLADRTTIAGAIANGSQVRSHNDRTGSQTDRSSDNGANPNGSPEKETETETETYLLEPTTLVPGDTSPAETAPRPKRKRSEPQQAADTANETAMSAMRAGSVAIAAACQTEIPKHLWGQAVELRKAAESVGADITGFVAHTYELAKVTGHRPASWTDSERASLIAAAKELWLVLDGTGRDPAVIRARWRAYRQAMPATAGVAGFRAWWSTICDVTATSPSAAPPVAADPVLAAELDEAFA